MAFFRVFPIVALDLLFKYQNTMAGTVQHRETQQERHQTKQEEDMKIVQ